MLMVCLRSKYSDCEGRLEQQLSQAQIHLSGKVRLEMGLVKRKIHLSLQAYLLPLGTLRLAVQPNKDNVTRHVLHPEKLAKYTDTQHSAHRKPQQK